MRGDCFSNKPSGELQAFFRRHFNNVTFIQGTVLDIPTLKLAKVCYYTVCKQCVKLNLGLYGYINSM